MNDPQLPANRLRAGDDDREQLLQVLQDAFAAGRLDTDELKERQDKALAIRYVDEGQGIVADLPEATRLDAAKPTAQPAVHRSAGPVEGLDLGGHVAIMSGKDRQLPAGTVRFSSFAWWGGDEIDLTQAMGPGRTIVLELSAIMGGNAIYVPDGVRILDESIAIMGGNSMDSEAKGDGSNGTLILKGFLFWGGNTVELADDD